MMEPLVSILIPTYNAEKWIKETIASAIEQTWKRKEIIIVDDGSTDNTMRILNKYKTKLAKIISQNNAGGPAARNKALKYAQGDYIQWLDHDDLLDRNKIQNQLQIHEYNRNAQILYSGTFGTFFTRVEKANIIPSKLWKDLTPIDYFMLKFEHNIWLHPSVWLVSRVLTELAGPWCEMKSPDDDGEYFSRVVSKCKQIVYVPEARSFWRVGNVRSVSNEMTDETQEAYFITMSKTIEQCRLLEDSDRTRKAGIKYMQQNSHFVNQNNYELVERVQALAKEMGGEIKFKDTRYISFAGKTVGRQMAMKIRKIFWYIRYSGRRIKETYC